jgi:SagB-type dehydrogenase family enzyme
MDAQLAEASQQALTLYCTSPLVRIDRPAADESVRISAGSGSSRESLQVRGADLVRCLIAAAAPAALDSLVADFTTRLKVGSGDASAVIDSLIAAGVLVTAEESQWLRDAGAMWEHYGWRDAFDFHFAVYGQEWDRTRRLEYEDALRGLYDDVGKVGPQPPSIIERDGESIPLAGYAKPVSAPLLDALCNAVPINVFTEFGIDLESVASLLSAAHGVRKSRELVLGEHLFKATPSGGARQPVEVYLAAREVRGLEPGVYHYAPKSNSLTRIRGAESVAGFDATCFDKGGIKTSSAILFFTYRQLRHAWKYRYSRTYRMILMELGHNVQTTRIAAAGLGLDVYYNPAIDDARVRALLGLPDDCEESPMLSMGLGRGGTV